MESRVRGNAEGRFEVVIDHEDEVEVVDTFDTLDEAIESSRAEAVVEAEVSVEAELVDEPEAPEAPAKA
jgi:hypothetical protein